MAAYLGFPVSLRGDPFEDVRYKVVELWCVIRRLKKFWNNRLSGATWKLRVLSALLTPKICYGLETVILSKRATIKLDAAMHGVLRKIYEVPPTHVNRLYSNQWLLDMAAQQVYPGERKFPPGRKS